MIALQLVVNLIQRELDKNLAAWGQATDVQAKDRYNYVIFILAQLLEVLKSYGK